MANVERDLQTAIAAIEAQQLNKFIKDQLSKCEEEVGEAFFVIKIKDESYKISAKIDAVARSIVIKIDFENDIYKISVVRRYTTLVDSEIVLENLSDAYSNYHDKNTIQKHSWFITNFIKESGLIDTMKSLMPFFRENHLKIVRRRNLENNF